MAKKFDEAMFDKRTVKKHLGKGHITDGDYADFLRSLPDESKNVDYVKVFEEDNTLTFASVESVK